MITKVNKHTFFLEVFNFGYFQISDISCKIWLRAFFRKLKNNLMHNDLEIETEKLNRLQAE